eukprot:1141042-Pelagomonas_calceolata.AAC.2
MGFLRCVTDAHAGKSKMRPMFSSCVGMRGCVLKDESSLSYFGLYLDRLDVQAVFDFLLQHNKELFCFMSELLDLLLAGMD